jgi:aminoglycoside phosphotransferase (APT) family kinase protein
MFRLGDELAVRLPRRAVAAELVRNEQQWLPRVAGGLPIQAPIPVHTGTPALGYPWHWSVVSWLPGAPVDQAQPHADEGQTLGAFLRALHVPAPDNAPENPVRGVPLADRASGVEERLTRLRTSTDAITPEVNAAWRDALEAPETTHAHWLHGDLHARNVLVHEGRISGIIDWGDITSGDVATDLASIWMLFEDSAARAIAIESYGGDEDTWRRARGWAVLFGAVLLDSGLVDNPRHAAMGRATLQRLAEDLR